MKNCEKTQFRSDMMSGIDAVLYRLYQTVCNGAFENSLVNAFSSVLSTTSIRKLGRFVINSCYLRRTCGEFSNAPLITFARLSRDRVTIRPRNSSTLVGLREVALRCSPFRIVLTLSAPKSWNEVLWWFQLFISTPTFYCQLTHKK